MAQALGNLAGDERARLEMAERAYAYTRSWVWREVGRQYAELYHGVLAESVAPARIAQASA
jgi:hypothetical protein